ncbi:MAG: hypothetical protein K2P27_02860 [Lachnospiraceae bacterium]|nr:hypothetical protein [Lachnospiraceae bacterium]
MVNERKSLHFELLGSFSCEGAVLKSGRKVLSFLQYLIVHHERNISAAELIEEFWPERSDTPANALRRMLLRARNLLRELYPYQEELLLTLPGCYAWNPEVSLELDIKQFEDACLEAGRKKGTEQVESLLRAVSLYKGDFLSANDSRWVAGPRQYYRTLYLDACKTLLPLLEQEERWIEMMLIGEQAYEIDFSVEDFTFCQMQALIALNQPEQAVEKYENFRNRMLEEFQIEPSDRVEKLCSLAAGVRNEDLGISEIFELLSEEDPGKRAFFCSFEMFQNIVSLERRHLLRSKGNAMLIIVRLGQGAVPAADVRRLERILLEGLRAGDPVARLETGSYIFLLTGADAENAQMVVSRLDRAFHKIYRRSQAHMTYHMEALSFED